MPNDSSNSRADRLKANLGLSSSQLGKTTQREGTEEEEVLTTSIQDLVLDLHKDIKEPMGKVQTAGMVLAMLHVHSPEPDNKCLGDAHTSVLYGTAPQLGNLIANFIQQLDASRFDDFELMIIRLKICEALFSGKRDKTSLQLCLSMVAKLAEVILSDEADSNG